MNSTVRPESFKMRIQGGMLEALGINMYTTLGKCLVEFVANAFDGEANSVDIKIPFDEIATARKDVREKAKKEVAEGLRDRFDVLLEPLPENVKVVISDDGHGMTWSEMRDKYLPLNRKRRTDVAGKESQIKSESGRRYVMGRKGLGKLAGFGAATSVSVWSKRKGEDFATVVTLRDEDLKFSDNITDVPIPAKYEDNLDPDLQGTTVTLSGLKSDAVRERSSTLDRIISEAFFGIRRSEFEITINGQAVETPEPEYALIYPESRDEDGFSAHTFSVEDVGDVSIRYFVGFRKKHVPASRRGARIYCNNRLAAGPSLLDLPTGMHSFHSTDYLECVVEADELDRASVDFVNTNRSQLREDTEVVRRLYEEVTDIMKEAVRAHAKFKEQLAIEQIENDDVGRFVSNILADMPKKTQAAGRKLLVSLAAEFGVESSDFQELSKATLQSMNATDVLADLVHLRSNPETLQRVVSHLRELSELERDDALKLYRARRNGIAALDALMDKGEEHWNKVGIESELHELLKANPWLIRPELSNYLASDIDLSKTVTQVAQALNVDEFSTIEKESGQADKTRPDLVFLMSDPSLEGPFVLNVVELKSPSIPLDVSHRRQLEDYLFKIRDWCSRHIDHSVSIRGFLIGAMPIKDKMNLDQRHLMQHYESQGAASEIRIIGIRELIRLARATHIEAIHALEKLEEDRSGDNHAAISSLAL